MTNKINVEGYNKVQTEDGEKSIDLALEVLENTLTELKKSGKLKESDINFLRKVTVGLYTTIRFSFESVNKMLIDRDVEIEKRWHINSSLTNIIEGTESCSDALFDIATTKAELQSSSYITFANDGWLGNSQEHEKDIEELNQTDGKINEVFKNL